ncbi:YceI family protein [Sulfuricurvum kujiense DSM 16994]|uniref:YceI family protein n=1 Tax=Sulfuricurvum kujiense (strain ATCC BAA-921 / DSM 16994 / JCM 11577 / YK-1) TaxID=709032 RepID=E4TYF2_SULKY|nr:YceI family protein [Sulfuricurvum kujiense]ADR35097.1 YceI family protein [Sulfuricurvum kujiense DSM 16994]
MIGKLSITAVLLAASVYAGNLSFESGTIKAHTEVFGDSTIDPMAKKATSHLSMDASPSTLKGAIEVSMSDLFSDNKKRDEHMQEALESASFPKATFDIKEVVAKGGDSYTLKGTMTLHGVSKPMSFEGTISEEGNKVRIKAASGLKMTDYGIKPIKMMFLTVRDQVDLSVDVSLKR